jgi:hypothetical protein
MRNLLFYLAMVLMFSFGIYCTLRFGSRLESGRFALEQRHEHSAAIASLPNDNKNESALSKTGEVLRENMRAPLSILLLQITVILLVHTGPDHRGCEGGRFSGVSIDNSPGPRVYRYDALHHQAAK